VITRHLLDAALARSPAQALFRRRSRRRLTVLAYHAVTDARRFERQLDLIARVGRPVALDGVLAAAAGERELPPAALLVTFDDGDRSVLEVALPLLRERGIPAVVFVVAGLLDGDAPPWWREAEGLEAAGGTCSALPGRLGRRLVAALKRLPDEERRLAIAELRSTAGGAAPPEPQLRTQELATLEAAGLEIGSHTLSHPCLPRCPDATVTEEIESAHARLTAALGRPPRAFAYPNGDHDPRAEALLARLGYRAAFLFDHRPQPLPLSMPLRFSRVRVNSDTGLDRFRIILSGLHPALHHAMGRA